MACIGNMAPGLLGAELEPTGAGGSNVISLQMAVNTRLTMAVI